MTEATKLIEQALYYLHINTEIGQHLMIRKVDNFDNEETKVLNSRKGKNENLGILNIDILTIIQNLGIR